MSMWQGYYRTNKRIEYRKEKIGEEKKGGFRKIKNDFWLLFFGFSIFFFLYSMFLDKCIIISLQHYQ